MKAKDLIPVTAWLKEEEHRKFMMWVHARGVSQSAYIREQLTFDVLPRGAPKGHQRRRKRGQSKSIKR